MVDVALFKKNKIDLNEYEVSKDILNRTLMSKFTPRDVEVLEEILYSSIRIPFTLLEKNLSLTSEELNAVLKKLSKTELFEVKGDHVLVDKEMRKYYEFQILKFEEEFKPGMDYLQGLLRKVPIHVLPNWYSISRTSDNIFHSIIEKYFFTPQIFQRYLMELNLTDPVQKGIMNALYKSPNYELDANDMIQKFSISREEFERHMVFLEFSFVCCVKFTKVDDRFVEVITPFYEWQEYLCHIKNTEPRTLIDEEKIKRVKNSDFAVIEELNCILELAKKEPITASRIPEIKKKCPEFKEGDFEDYLEKLCKLNLADMKDGGIICNSDSIEWLKMKKNDQAVFMYRHPSYSLDDSDLPEELSNQKIIHDAVKCVCPIANFGWVFLDEFLKGIFIPLNESHLITLKRHGRTWKYHLPEYNETELEFFRKIITEYLYELGIVALGKKDGRDCFCLTPFGHDLFGNE